MKQAMVRRLDELGRIVLPVEMRNALGWDETSKIAISRQGDRVVLRAYQNSCVVCGSEENLTPVRERHICQGCIQEIITPRLL